MRLVPSFVLIATLATAARADDTCDIRVTRAPEQVRAAIEARVGIEAACTALDVRVTRKKRHGFHVTATTQDGEVLEGDARDPGLVGELVMTWAKPAEPALAAAEPAPVPAVTEPAVEPPSATEPIEVHARATPSVRESDRDLAVGVIATPSTYGLRIEVDALATHGFSLGVAAGGADALLASGDAMTGATVDLRDLAGSVIAAKTFGTAAWRLRIQAGLGVVYTRYTAKARTAPFDRIASGDGMTRMFEGAITLSRDIGASWAVSAGPLMTYFAQTFQLEANRRVHRELDVGGYLALRRRY